MKTRWTGYAALAQEVLDYFDICTIRPKDVAELIGLTGSRQSRWGMGHQILELMGWEQERTPENCTLYHRNGHRKKFSAGAKRFASRKKQAVIAKHLEDEEASSSGNQRVGVDPCNSKDLSKSKE